jgi:hypothetical protein
MQCAVVAVLRRPSVSTSNTNRSPPGLLGPAGTMKRAAIYVNFDMVMLYEKGPPLPAGPKVT